MRLLLALWLLVATPAYADVKVDWARGLVIADAVGVADRHAPNPAVARGTSRRVAEEAAERALAAKLGELPLAGGGKVADRAKDPATKARLDRVIEAAYPLAADPQTDGSWRVTMAIPIEAVRQALDGPRAWPAAGDEGPQVVVVEGVGAKPAVGWQIAGRSAASVWVTELPAWAKDAPRVRARSAKAGSIELAGIAAGPATLFVIVTK